MIHGGKAASVVALVVLSGCTAQAGKPSTLPPLPSPSTSPAPSPTPSPSVAPTPRPHGTDVQQIAALARGYYEESNRAIRTGDTARLRLMSTGNCECLAFATNLERVWKNGKVISPIYYRISGVARPTVTSATAGFATVLYSLNKAVYLDRAGKVTQTFPADKRPQSASLDFVKINGVWKVSLDVQN